GIVRKWCWEPSHPRSCEKSGQEEKKRPKKKKQPWRSQRCFPGWSWVVLASRMHQDPKGCQKYFEDPGSSPSLNKTGISATSHRDGPSDASVAGRCAT